MQTNLVTQMVPWGLMEGDRDHKGAQGKSGDDRYVDILIVVMVSWVCTCVKTLNCINLYSL